jgi:uncharacterized protein involved in response to NO
MNHAPAPFLEAGFRPFFFAATLGGIALIVFWGFEYGFSGAMPPTGLHPVVWHGHEMLVGYAAAVVAGFLLTAVTNWTGRPTLVGPGLGALAAVWLAARLALFVPGRGHWIAFALESLFFLGLGIALFRPVIAARRWGDMEVLAKVPTLWAAGLLIHLGAAGILDAGIRWGLYTALYTVVGLIMVIGRRVIPFFIERGTGGKLTWRPPRWQELVGLVVFLAFWILDAFTQQKALVALTAAALLVIHGVRLYAWHHPALWSRPMVWVLYLGYAWIVAAFALKAAGWWWPQADALALHAFGYGGIGLLTAGMMVRVTLGHTGRNPNAPPRGVVWIFLPLALGPGARRPAPGGAGSLHSVGDRLGGPVAGRPRRPGRDLSAHVVAALGPAARHPPAPVNPAGAEQPVYCRDFPESA